MKAQIEIGIVNAVLQLLPRVHITGAEASSMMYVVQELTAAVKEATEKPALDELLKGSTTSDYEHPSEKSSDLP